MTKFNTVVYKEGGYLSFLPKEGDRGAVELFDSMLGVKRVEETAFVVEGEDYMGILEGDWRDDCAELETMDECMVIFWDNIHHATGTSQHDLLKSKPVTH